MSPYQTVIRIVNGNLRATVRGRTSPRHRYLFPIFFLISSSSEDKPRETTCNYLMCIIYSEWWSSSIICNAIKPVRVLYNVHRMGTYYIHLLLYHGRKLASMKIFSRTPTRRHRIIISKKNTVVNNYQEIIIKKSICVPQSSWESEEDTEISTLVVRDSN